MRKMIYLFCALLADFTMPPLGYVKLQPRQGSRCLVCHEWGHVTSKLFREPVEGYDVYSTNRWGSRYFTGNFDIHFQCECTNCGAVWPEEVERRISPPGKRPQLD